MTLFKLGQFKLAGGETSWWKLDCDALTDEDIIALACLLGNKLPPFGAVEGVPTGGLRIAKALRSYATEGPLLIVDDVWTTGGSMEKYRADRDAIGAVLFARGPVAPWVLALWQLSA